MKKSIKMLSIAALACVTSAFAEGGMFELTEEFLGLVEVALSLCESLLHVSQTSTGHCAELLDIVN